MANNGFMLAKALRNPQEFLNQYMNNSQAMQNPIAKNAIEMYQKGDRNGINELANNLCKEKGINRSDLEKQIKSQIGI